MRPLHWFVGLAFALYAAPVVAQRLTKPWVPGAVSLRTSGSSIRPVHLDSSVAATPAGRAFAALLGGATGFVAGGIIGYHLDSRSGGSDELGLEGAAWGAVLGEGLGMVAAATLASPNQSKPIDWLAVPAIAVAGVALVAATGHAELLLLIPAVQIYELLSGRPEPEANADPDGPTPL
ncbi:MAG TPA: hypothetical protein VNX15_11690 [Gemmatimonadales bacterium]|jgi:hypothetical protein|nr:hypothetical protein [Gemmatimonadales bacterium]